jgi:hypothetical protein
MIVSKRLLSQTTVQLCWLKAGRWQLPTTTDRAFTPYLGMDGFVGQAAIQQARIVVQE